MDDIKIREANVEDIKNIVPVHMRAWKCTYAGIVDAEYLDKKTNPENYPPRIEKFEQFFLTKKEDIFFVAEVENKIVGFISGGNPQNTPETDKEIAGLYVDPDYHKLGIGKMLFDAFIHTAKAQNAKTIGIGCLRDNRSVGFYKKMGCKVLREGFWEYEKGKVPETFFIFEIANN